MHVGTFSNALLTLISNKEMKFNIYTFLSQCPQHTAAMCCKYYRFSDIQYPVFVK